MDPDLLRTFLAFADGGSLARAAEAVNRSPSAVTAQMQRLEDLVGIPLLEPSGRGRVLTPAGVELVPHARRILAAHREAWLSLKGVRADGRLAIGSTQDFAHCGLPQLITAFARTHPRVRLELRIGRSGELAAAFAAGTLDAAITMRAEAGPHQAGAIREPMVWLCAADGLIHSGEELPLALLDPPCGFRTAAVSALEASGQRYRIAATSGSLAGLRAAVEGGIAVTLRTRRWSGRDVEIAPNSMRLPEAGEAIFAIDLRPDAGAPASDFVTLASEMLAAGV